MSDNIFNCFGEQSKMREWSDIPSLYSMLCRKLTATVNKVGTSGNRSMKRTILAIMARSIILPANKTVAYWFYECRNRYAAVKIYLILPGVVSSHITFVELK